MVQRVLILNYKKMKKYFLKESGKEVKVGDTIRKTDEMIHPILGKCKSTMDILITESILPKLIEAGIIGIKEDKPTYTSEDFDIECCIQKIADRMGWQYNKTVGYLNKIDEIYPIAAFSILLREIAVELDKKYENHIENSEEIYTISTLNGKITKVNKVTIKNYRNFAAFRSVNDAKIACNICKKLLKQLFSNKNGE